MECKKMYFLLIITIFSPLTLAVWQMNMKDDIPQNDGNLRTCKEWIEFYGVNDGNYLDLLKAIQNRNYVLDQELSRFFVGYATRINILGAAERYKKFNAKISPTDFCIEMDSESDSKSFEFEALKNVKETCSGFIYFYGYSPNNVLYNHHMAKLMRSRYQQYEAIWSSMYQFYLKNFDIKRFTEPLLPRQFCDYLGKFEPALKMPIVTFRVIPSMSCVDVIKLFDYTDDAQTNHLRAQVIYKDELNDLLPEVVLAYIKDLLNTDVSQAKTIEKFCDLFRSASTSSS